MSGRYQILVLLAVALAVAAAFWLRSSTDKGSGDVMAQVQVPELSGQAALGAAVFSENCATCHGVNAAGKDGAGPPLVHKIYESSHHGDMAFVLAAQQGVRQHHWSFGNMPARPHVTEPEILAVISYVRALQRANGIN